MFRFIALTNEGLARSDDENIDMLFCYCMCASIIDFTESLWYTPLLLTALCHPLLVSREAQHSKLLLPTVGNCQITVSQHFKASLTAFAALYASFHLSSSSFNFLRQRFQFKNFGTSLLFVTWRRVYLILLFTLDVVGFEGWDIERCK